MASLAWTCEHSMQSAAACIGHVSAAPCTHLRWDFGPKRSAVENPLSCLVSFCATVSRNHVARKGCWHVQHFVGCAVNADVSPQLVYALWYAG